MIVVGWNNGSPNNRTGAGYGIRIKRRDRDEHFRCEWTFANMELDKGDLVNIKLSNSFWKHCIELRSAKIGKWMIRYKIAPWPKGDPPHLRLEQINGNRFKLSRF